MQNVCEYCEKELGANISIFSSIDGFINGEEILFMHISDVDFFVDEIESKCKINFDEVMARIKTIKSNGSRVYFGLRPTKCSDRLLCATGSINTYLDGDYSQYRKACFIGLVNNSKYELKNGTIVTYIDGVMVNEDGVVNKAATMAILNKNLSQFTISKRL